ncbi:MAG: hypothetical protein JWP57_1551 [Spirosoma sp.]|nr:hypothetical protein [Spirosoma sp.]
MLHYAFCTFLLLATLSSLAQSKRDLVTQHVNRTDVEAITGVTLKDPKFTDVDFSRETIARYHSVKPRPYDAEVCIISVGRLDPIQYDQQLKVDKGMGYKGELTGLGDKAYWADLGQGIGAYTKVAVVKGKNILSVTLTDSKPGLTRLEATKQLVNKILPYL